MKKHSAFCSKHSPTETFSNNNVQIHWTVEGDAGKRAKKWKGSSLLAEKSWCPWGTYNSLKEKIWLPFQLAENNQSLSTWNT